jgi:hypothetical protein
MSQMTRPKRFLVRMGAFVAAVGVVGGVLAVPLQRIFLSNPALNGLILGVLVFGIGFIFRQVLMLGPEVEWADRVRRMKPGLTPPQAPTLLAPMATLLGDEPGRRTLSALAMRSLLDGIASRLDESRELARYLIGLLIFLGLLGTFWGLLQTVTAVGSTIHSLNMDSNDVAGMFGSLKAGLEAPLSGMGTAFSSSLFGLAGSLVLGFLELQAGQAQNRFYNDLEDWLTSFTRLSSGAGLGDGEGSVPAYVGALLEQTAESLDNLQRIVARNEGSGVQTNAILQQLGDRLATLSDQMRSEQDLMVKLVEGQIEIKPVLERLASGPRDTSGGVDDATRSHIRNIDVHVGRLLEESRTGRDRLIDELRSEIKLLARTIAALGRERT